ncbi:hypothetical protein FRB99_003610 [Tulasnella sp. 403]|nr:hypothetical protein FRB99_003610 [Tulasnella sp. 403]
MLPGGLRIRKESAVSLSTNNTGVSNVRAKSPTYSTTTAASDMPFSPGALITRADLRASIKAYDDTVTSLAAYRSALSTLSHASASLARSLETCSRLKGISDDAACGLQAAGGLHHVIANHEQVLGRSLYLNVEQPLKQHLEGYKAAVAERSAAYERTIRERSRIIRQTERENMGIGRRRQRDLNSFRQTLAILQAQVDDLDRLKAEYYESVMAHEEQVWDFVLGKVSYSVRSTLDVYDRITAKSSDPHLEPLIIAVPDPFDTYGPPKSEQQIFSILPPLAISMNISSSPSPSPAPTQQPSSAVGSGLPKPFIPSSAPSIISPTPSTPFGMPSWGISFPTSSTAPSLISGAAAWADARPLSTSPPPLPGPSSPPTSGDGLNGNHAHRNGIQPRRTGSTPTRKASKAESKLRNVLSSASEDESNRSQNSDSDSDAATEVDVARSPRNGLMTNPMVKRDVDDSDSDDTATRRGRSETPVQTVQERSTSGSDADVEGTPRRPPQDDLPPS